MSRDCDNCGKDCGGYVYAWPKPCADDPLVGEFCGLCGVCMEAMRDRIRHFTATHKLPRGWAEENVLHEFLRPVFGGAHPHWFPQTDADCEGMAKALLELQLQCGGFGGRAARAITA